MWRSILERHFFQAHLGQDTSDLDGGRMPDPYSRKQLIGHIQISAMVLGPIQRAER
jgi:hypothetical protein